MLFRPPRCRGGHRWPPSPRPYANTGHGSTSSRSPTPSCPAQAPGPPALGRSPAGAQRRPASPWKLSQTALRVCEQHPPAWSPERERHQTVFIVGTEGKRGSEGTRKNDREKGRSFSQAVTPQSKGAPGQKSEGWLQRVGRGSLCLRQPGPEASPTARGMFWDKARACRSSAARGGASP